MVKRLGGGKPESRRINKYFKSLERSKFEEARRAMVLELGGLGLSAAEVALRVGASKRTVQRILHDAEPSVQRSFQRSLSTMADEERVRVLGQLEGLSPKGQLEFLTRKLARMQKTARRVPVCRKLLVTFNVDAALAGRPAWSFRPARVRLVPPAVINFRFIIMVRAALASR